MDFLLLQVKFQLQHDFGDKPLVSFVAKSRPPTQTNGIKRSLPIIVRKKASLADKKQLFQKFQVQSVGEVSKSSTQKKSECPISKSNKTSQTGVISSLFSRNLDIPAVSKKHVESKDESVFSSFSFSSLNIHKFLVKDFDSIFN